MSQSGAPTQGAPITWLAMPLTAPNTINPHSTGPVELHISNSYNATFGIPPRVKLVQFDSSDWSKWLGTFEAILTLCKAEDHLCYCTCPFDADEVEWANVQWQLKAFLCLYMSSGVYSQNLPTQPSKTDGSSSSSSTLEPPAALQFLITASCSLRPTLMRTNP